MPKLLFAVLALLICDFTTVAVFAQERPNFLWIMSEDNSKHYLKLFDENGAATPNIAEMAKNGVLFERAFSNAPVCSVARTTLITGVYAPRLGTQYHRRLKPAVMPEDWKMFPAYLKQHGYFTTNNSKKDYNAVEGNGVWDASSRKATWRPRQSGQPFFHVQTYTDSHESSLHFPQSWVDAPDNNTDPNSINLAPYHPDTSLFRLTYARYHDRIQVIDDKVGQLIEKLKQDGELENTFVFYFGDHGGVLPRGKGFAYESGLHVPLVVRVPEKWKSKSIFQKGERTKKFVEFVDFGPTVLSLAGIQVPSFMDGESFMTQVEESKKVPNETLGYADRMDEKYDQVRTLRRGNLKYIRNYMAFYPDGLQNNYRYVNLAWQQWRQLYRGQKLSPIQRAFFEARPPEQLFDLEKDPYEVNDLSQNPEYSKQLSQMRLALTAKVKSLPDLGMFPESELVKNALESPIEFGQTQKSRIAKLVDTADLALIPFNQAEKALVTAIQSDDPLERYWAYIVCSIHSNPADSVSNLARKSVQYDPHPLVKLRAAEFLGLTDQVDPVPTINEIVTTSDSSA
ncbi:MAG: sulfatase, partial [Planctomycetota bacterium]